MLRHALGLSRGELELGQGFRRELTRCIGYAVPESAYVAIDYRLDWLAMALYIDCYGWPCEPVANTGLVQGTQDDVDLLVQFAERGDEAPHIALIECRGDGSWSNAQLWPKIARMMRLFECRRAKPHFVLVSAARPRRVNTEHWPTWAKSEKGDEPLWFPAPRALERNRPVLCDPQGAQNVFGNYVRVVTARSS